MIKKMVIFFVVTFFLIVFVNGYVNAAGVNSAQYNDLGIEKIVLDKDIVTGKINYAWSIVHKKYKIELDEGFQQVPIFSVLYEGPEHEIQERTIDILERLSLAFDLIDNGAFLYVVTNDRITHFTLPYTADKVGCKDCPAIYAINPSSNLTPLRIITIYPNDASLYGNNGSDKQLRLAHYIKSQIEAHYTLFKNKSVYITNYENLLIDKLTYTGKIYKEVYLRTKEYMAELESDTMAEKHLTDSLARIERNQRIRLKVLSHLLPIDWPLNQYWK